MRYILTGDEISAEEAYRIGLVQAVAPPGEHLQQAIAIAENIAAQAPLGVQASLASGRIARVQGDKAAIARLLPDLMPIMRSEDVKEGVQSFVERRPARFVGR
jgi:enoyl-CoA hydratase/carnithine racemase